MYFSLVISLLFFDFAFAENQKSCAGLLNTKHEARLIEAFPTDQATLQKIIKEEKSSQRISEFLMKSFREESLKLKQQLKADDSKFVYDMICIGSGVQCAAASLVASQNNLKALVIEKSHLVARNFAEKDFKINSAENRTFSMHVVPGSVLQLAELTSQKYASSLQLATKIQADQYVSNIPVLLDTEVRSLVPYEGNVILTMTDGSSLKSRKVIIGTGLGKVSTKVPFSEYKNQFILTHQAHQNQSNQIFPIMSTDSFLVSLKNIKAQNLGVHLPRDIVIIGNGDGARIALEGLSEIALNPETRIFWVGNHFKTADEYIQSVAGWDRYIQKIIPHYEAGRLTGVDGRVEEIKSLDVNRYQIKIKNSQTGMTQSLIGDMIIDSTGYENVAQSLLPVGARRLDVIGNLAAQTAETVLGRQYEFNHLRVPIYEVGAAGGSLATETELSLLRNKNAISIYNTVPRTVALISKIFGFNLPKEFDTGIRSERPDVLNEENIMKKLKEAREKNRNQATDIL